MIFKKIFKEKELRPDQLNDENQITDSKILGKDRIKFGVGSIMYQSEEAGLTPIHTLLIRLLGGSNVHLGIVAAAGSIGSFVQWIGAVFLNKFRSNKIAMNVALALGVFFSLFLCLTLVLFEFSPSLKAMLIIFYLIGAFGLAGASGIQMNIETSWIGDLVPVKKLGWFTSIKWVIASLGVLVFLVLFGWAADISERPITFALIFFLVGVSHLVAIFLMSTVTDRKPKVANFIKAKDESATNEVTRIDYSNKSLWLYIWFYFAWAGGRTALAAFTTAYMLDYFQFGMTKIALLTGLQNVINLIMLIVIGKLSDKYGTRKPLLLVSGIIAFSMLLWIGSAWIGVWAIIIYQLLNGVAGNTHSMLGINYGLEIFPSEGRAAYIGFSRIFIGLSAMVGAVLSGFIVDSLVGWEYNIAGVTLNHYHIFFLGCSLFTLSCVVPLILGGKKK